MLYQCFTLYYTVSQLKHSCIAILCDDWLTASATAEGPPSGDGCTSWSLWWWFAFADIDNQNDPTFAHLILMFVPPIFSPLPLNICLQSSILMSSSQSNKTEEEHVKDWSQGPLMGWMESKQTHWFTRWPGGGCPGRMKTWCWLRPPLGSRYLVVERVQSGPYLLFWCRRSLDHIVLIH